MTVREMMMFCIKLLGEAKGDYIFDNDGYTEIDLEVNDDTKTVRIW